MERAAGTMIRDRVSMVEIKHNERTKPSKVTHNKAAHPTVGALVVPTHHLRQQPRPARVINQAHSALDITPDEDPVVSILIVVITVCCLTLTGPCRCQVYCYRLLDELYRQRAWLDIAPFNLS